ncbi:MAG: hypothetical protein DGJ47_000918 [Rickettsiaceae bacterium]
MPIDLSVRNIIRDKGYIRIDEMMRQVLSDGNSAYYKTLSEIGFNGDFTTSPEISQLFGEMIALWAIDKWRKLGKPQKFSLVELGPGQGVLMSDLLRGSKVDPEFFKAVQVFLYDINPNFIQKQQNALKGYSNINWINDLESLPQAPTLIISNEFFDALPTKQYMKVKDKWRESVMIVDPQDSCIKHNAVDIHQNLQEQLLLDHVNASDGSVFEESVESLRIMRVLSKHIKDNRGSILTIDYGYNIPAENRTSRQYNATLQAIKDHKYVSIIDTLGEADLTTHVNFNALILASKEQGEFDYIYQNQQDFLLSYGIKFRAKQLQKTLNTDDAMIIDRQLDRLISPQMMGDLFKVLEINYFV